MTAEDETLLEAVQDTFLDFIDLFVESVALSSVWYWLLVFLSLVAKETLLKPIVEEHSKRSYLDRERTKQRRLKDTLKDPLLVSLLEKRLLKSANGDEQEMQEAMGHLRSKAAAPIEPLDSKTMKGEIQKETAFTTLTGTMLVSILLCALQNLIIGDISVVVRVIPTYVFCFIHIVHSYIEHNKASKKYTPRRRKVETDMETPFIN